ncbi:hypothetical protein GBA52_013817 [Prunus armeniaca]|nr:hypothetical protein GBA52_013817 [Prunus armeniaca]
MEMLADSKSSDRYITTALLEADSHGEEGTERNRRSWKKAYLDVDEAKKQVAEKMIAEGERFDLSLADGLGEEGSKRRWWNKLLDVEEAKVQVYFSLPTILTNVFFSLIPLVSVMFAGHLGELQLAGATLANSWANVTGFAFVVINFLVILENVLLSDKPILILLHQDPQISRCAAVFLKFLFPGLFAYGFLQNILRFHQTQSVYVMPMVFSGIAFVIHIGITYVLVHWTALGFKGAPLAASISLWISVLMMAFNVNYTKSFERTWEGFSIESFNHILTGLKLALPSATMECLEEWAFEILVFMGGLMPNSAKTTSLLAICVNTQEIGYMVTYGLSAAASTRVSNELGAGNPGRAKNAMVVTLKLSVLLSFAIILALAFGHNVWAGFFIDSNASYAVLREDFASMTPLLAISIIVDSVQGVFAGVARGCGWQHLAVYVNLATFYLIGMTIAGLLGFTFKLYAKGLWIGIICGLSFQASTLLLITLLKKWTQSDSSEHPEEGSPVLLLDVEEAKKQVLFSLPTTLTNVMFYFITLVSVMFAGHLGKLQLAAANLAMSWASATGLAVVVIALCGQAFGAREYGMLGKYLQASCLISLLASLLISLLWFFSEPVLISLLHQDAEASKLSVVFMKLFIPGLVAFGILQNVLRFLQTQSAVVVPFIFSFISLGLHIGLTYYLVHFTPLGFRGVPLAASISFCLSLLMFAVYILRSKKFESTWEGFSLASFSHVPAVLRLGLPGAAVECLEDWTFEVLVFMAGAFPHPTQSTSLLGICVNVELIGYMVSYGLSAAVSTRVSNELGAGNPEKAKSAMTVALKLSGFLAFLLGLALAIGHNFWAGLFGRTPEIVKAFASMTPLVAVSVILEPLQGVVLGVATGCGWQKLVCYVNLATYLVGMAISGLLGLTTELHAKGLWIGLMFGISCQTSIILVTVLLKNWAPRSDTA